MTSGCVLDASAVLCLVHEENGSHTVLAALPGASISSVNLCEVASRLVEHGMPLSEIEDMLGSLGVRTEPFGEELALDAASLRLSTRSAGLSLGDRACLSTARQLGVRAVTADRAWAKLGPVVGVEIELVR